MGQDLKPEGQNLKDTLENMIATPDYQALTPGPEGGRSFAISRIVHQFREQAKHQLLAEDPDVREKVLGLKTKKVEARTGQPYLQ